MRNLITVIVVVITFTLGLHIGAQNEVKTHKAYIASLNLGGK